MTNLYDKFPGIMDYDLPNYAQPIDIDMDGEPEFLPVEGEPGTYTIGDTTVVFH